MSFATETKNELARVEPEKKCCMLAEISGFLRTAGSVHLKGSGRYLIAVSTENPAIARHYKKLIREYFGVETELEIGAAAGPRKGRTYRLAIGPEMRSEQILRETGVLLVREGRDFFSDGIYSGLIRTKCCRKAYLRGLFLGSGTISDPAKSYHLEFICGSKNLAEDLRKMINTFDDLSAKVVERKGKFVVYMKQAAYICDTLSLMEAHTKRLEFENVTIRKELVNETVRKTNCDTANADRAVDASQRQLASIRKIEALKGLSFLPEKLREVAQLRLDNPEASLIQLAEMMDPPMKKSGINNRFRKIEEIASKL